jgi:DNA-binding NtrC family response regulator
MTQGAHHRGLVVLIVEDEWLVRTAAAQSLSEAGFAILETDRTDHAIAHLRERARQIHALFTDVHVPGPMDGLALAHLSRRSWPWVGLLIVSGRAKPAAHELPDGARFLAKPYETEHVISHLWEMAEGVASSHGRH